MFTWPYNVYRALFLPLLFLACFIESSQPVSLKTSQTSSVEKEGEKEKKKKSSSKEEKPRSEAGYYN